MTIVGFGFTKIEIERLKPSSGRINIRNNIAIKGVEEYTPGVMGKKTKGLRFLFEFVSNYTPDVGNIRLYGEVFFMGEAKKCIDIVKSWEKDKKIPPEVMPEILNYALSKSNVEAIALSRDVALPPPMPMPRLNTNKEKNNYIG